MVAYFKEDGQKEKYQILMYRYHDVGGTLEMYSNTLNLSYPFIYYCVVKNMLSVTLQYINCFVAYT